jgi:hypothetical protein
MGIEMHKSRFAPIFLQILLAFLAFHYAALAQQSEPAWEEGIVGRVEVALFQGSHVDKPGHVSIFRATGCTYIKTCGWAVTMEVQQTSRRLILEKKIPVHNRIVSMHYEEVNLREGDHIRMRQGNQKDVYVLLDRDGKPHDFSVKQVVPLFSQTPQSGQEASANGAALSQAATSGEKIHQGARWA